MNIYEVDAIGMFMTVEPVYIKVMITSEAGKVAQLTPSQQQQTRLLGTELRSSARTASALTEHERSYFSERSADVGEHFSFSFWEDGAVCCAQETSCVHTVMF